MKNLPRCFSCEYNETCCLHYQDVFAFKPSPFRNTPAKKPKKHQNMFRQKRNTEKNVKAEKWKY